jgi:hypothetical protein
VTKKSSNVPLTPLRIDVQGYVISVVANAWSLEGKTPVFTNTVNTVPVAVNVIIGAV